jgi:hypothetical protein
MTPHQGRYAAYYRVSTGRQGASGLGLDAQKQKVQDFLDGGRWQLTASFTEIESGRRGDRPELGKALAYCKRQKGTKLIVATLSRLTRDTRFLLTLLDGNVEVVFADLPQVHPGLAEAGCSEDYIASISGHKDYREIRRYVRAANKAKMMGVIIERPSLKLPHPDSDEVA